MSVIITGVGLAIIVISWMWYLALIPAERVPARPYLHAALMVVGMGLCAIGAAELAIGPLIMGASGWLLGGFFLYLLSVAALPDGELTVAIGDPLPAFTAADHRGQVIASSDWHGERVLLKFFRGHW